MFKSIFNKLMAAYLIILLVALIMVGILMANFLQDYYVGQKKQQLLNQGQRINELAVEYMVGYIDDKSLSFALDSINSTINASIWFVDNKGYIWVESGFTNGGWKGVKLTTEEVGQVLSGQTIYKTGRFNDRFSTPMITVGIPMRVGQSVVGAIFMHSPLYEINRALSGVYRYIWLSALISAAVGTIMLYWISQHISRPLVEMSNIAKAISKGDFTQKASVVSNDEVGQLAISFNKMAEALEDLENMRRSFVSNVSHELKSPLTTIKGFIQGILDGTIPSEEQEYYLNIVLEEAERLNKITKDLLDLSRMESGEFHMNIYPFDINELIRRVLLKEEKRIDEKKLDIRVQFGQERYMVEADRDRIEQVLINLIDNAIKFSREGGYIVIETEKKGPCVYVSIKDNGIGISEEDLPHIWEQFYTADKSRSLGGTGLGLSIVKRIIEQHQQNIYVQSVLGEGTTFTFTLKVAAEI